MDDKKTTIKIQETLEKWFKSLPPLPADFVNSIYKVTPILSLIFGVLGVVLSLISLSVFSTTASVMSATNGAPFIGFAIIVSTLGWLAASVMMLLAYTPLKAGKISGWNMLFWSQMVSMVTAFVGISLGTILMASVGFYILFQLKPKFK